MKEMYEEKYERAKKQIKSEKEWYSHLFVYIVICTLEQMLYGGVFDGGEFFQYMPLWGHFVTPVLWGIGVLLHWLYVFKKVRYMEFYKKWEQRKIEKYMSEDDDF